MLQRLEVIALVAAVCGAWCAGVWAHATGALPMWALCGLGVAVLAVALAAGSWILNRRVRDDAFSPWRQYRAARSVVVQASGPDQCTLTLELCPEADLVGRGVTLRFRGVGRLRVQQFDTMVLCFDYLVCHDRGAGAAGKRFRIRDRWGEAISFWCDSFEEVRDAAKGGG